MAQQNPDPSVHGHREEPVFNLIDSNADDGFKDALLTELVNYLFSRFELPEDDWSCKSRKFFIIRVFDEFWPLKQFQIIIACRNKTEEQFWLDMKREFKLLSFTRAADHREGCKWRSKTWLDFGECPLNYSPSLHTGSFLYINPYILLSVNQVKPMGTNIENNLSLYNEEFCVAIAIDLVEAVKLDGKMTSQLLEYFPCCNLDKHKETMPKEPLFQLDDTFNHHKRKHVPSFVVFPIICLWFLHETCSQTLLGKHLLATWIQVQARHKEHGPVSIGFPLLGLFSFMVFYWAVATMVFVGAQFTRMHGAMFFFWAILMHVSSDNSITALYLPILGIFFIGWYACGNATTKGEKLSSAV